MRNNIILGGIGIVVLAQLSMFFEVTHTDPVFWYVYVPLSVALGLFIRHNARRGKV
jgi:hypothetical protein